MPGYIPVIWDLDGTIANPENGIVESVIFALSEMNEPVPERPVLMGFVGPPLFDSFRNLFGKDEDKTQEAVRLYREYFEENVIMHIGPYPGIDSLISELHENGGIQLIATSRPTYYAKQILDNIGITSCFSGIFGSGMDGSNALKVDLVRSALSSEAATGDNPVVIGDRKFEVDAARALGIASISVTYGFGTMEEILSCNPTHIAHNSEDLRKILF